ncbi:MAG: DUF1499 domain-containing protein [Woeseia sp.]
MNPALAALGVAVIAALLLLVAGPGTRLGFWEFGTGFTIMRWALFLGLGAAVLAIILLLIARTREGKAATLLAAFVIGLAAAWLPWQSYRTVRSLPYIHDITTDTRHPPEFVDIAPLRATAPNPVKYPGEETAEQQREAYPHLRPLELDLPPAKAFDRALDTATRQGWEIVAAVPEEGRIEATATTFWFGFKDDVVIRVTPAGDGSRIDVRSKSRVGRSDVGANAARIRDFLEDFHPGAEGAAGHPAAFCVTVSPSRRILRFRRQPLTRCARSRRLLSAITIHL